MNRNLKATVFFTLALATAGRAQQRQAPPPPQMAGILTNITASGFHLQAIAPADRVLPYALCKAVQYAEKGRATTVGLTLAQIRPAAVKDWAVLDTDAKLDPASAQSSGLKLVTIEAAAKDCRTSFDWFH